MSTPRKQLDTLLKKRGHGSAHALAVACGVSDNAVWLWRHGKTRPSAVAAAKIERATGIAATSWLTARERRDLGLAA